MPNTTTNRPNVKALLRKVKTSTTPTGVQLYEVRLPRRGRGEAITAQLIGEPREHVGGKTEMVLDIFKGQPIDPLMDLARSLNYDAAVVVAAGINALQERAARGQDQPNLQDTVLEKHLANTLDEARLVAMHAGSLAKRLHMPVDSVIEALELLKSA